MKAETAYFHCGDQLKKTLIVEIEEIFSIIDRVKWEPSYKHVQVETNIAHQAGYNKTFDSEFKILNWEKRPILRTDPKLIGDFRKGLVFVEIQFGNSATLYRDYYKFQYGLANGLLSLAVLIVPTKPSIFFPTRPESVNNMAEFTLAYTCLSVLPINVPTLLIGLRPEN